MTSFRDVDSLPHAFGRPSASADYKLEPADFVVHEELGFEPSGAGEHVCLCIEKRSLNTLDVVQKLSRRFGIPRRDIAFAGLKDKRAVTRQWFSVRVGLKQDYPFSELNDENLTVLDIRRNHRKIKKGSHRGNRFVIRLKNVSPDSEELEARLENVRTMGVPNYFGPQRFGRDGGNLVKAERMFESGGRAVERFLRGIYLSAARAYLFNDILAERVAGGSWNRFIDGDTAALDGADRGFVPDAIDETLLERLRLFDVHPAGALWGRGEPPSCGAAAALETRIAAVYPHLRDGLAAHGLEHGRRALRARVQDLEMRPEGGDQVVLEFSLNQGVYATSVLRELVNLNIPGEDPEAEDWQAGVSRRKDASQQEAE